MATDDSAATPAAREAPEHHTHVKDVPLEELPLADALEYVETSRSEAQEAAHKALVQRDKHQRAYDEAMAAVQHFNHLEEQLLLKATSGSTSGATVPAAGPEPAPSTARVPPPDLQPTAEEEGIVPGLSSTPAPPRTSTSKPESRFESIRALWSSINPRGRVL